ncbi:MAG: acyl-ACP--UDP-N-acetylglucosamine O-acyltransferase [Pirellulales bacterium]|nr:acyl-ACP--UDP-N-acetylglucosamine O-acyltransferase [Pirellulales bacterium]
MTIHPTAVVSPDVRLGRDVQIGPFCVIESDVTIGDGCVLAAGVVVKSGTTLGRDNRVFESAVLGGFPQHVHVPERPGRVCIGDGNTLRESVTIHRALDENAVTTLGDHNLLMVNAHVAHDCHVGSHTIITNNTMLGGHVVVADRAYVSGAVAVHQFCRIGTLAMVGGQAHVVQDVPPFVNVDGLSSLVVGLNQIGLRRAGYGVEVVRQLKEAYRVVYRSRLPWKEILRRLATEFPEAPASLFHEFCAATTRGIVSERRLPPGATLKLRHQTEEESPLRVKVG